MRTEAEALAYIGCAADATEVQIWQAWRPCVRGVHPDTGNGDRATWERLLLAREILRQTAVKRRQCPDCRGSRRVTVTIGLLSSYVAVCPTCKGSGEKA